jgi:hypothetical protein
VRFLWLLTNGKLKAERNRSLARIEQRIEELCQRIGQQPIVQESSLIPGRQALDHTQPSAAGSGPQIDTTHVQASTSSQRPSPIPVCQPRCSESVEVSSDNTELLPGHKDGSFELREGTFYGQSLLPSLSHPTTMDENPGHLLLDKLGPLNELSTEVGDSPSSSHSGPFP